MGWISAKPTRQKPAGSKLRRHSGSLAHVPKAQQIRQILKLGESITHNPATESGGGAGEAGTNDMITQMNES